MRFCKNEFAFFQLVATNFVIGLLTLQHINAFLSPLPAKRSFVTSDQMKGNHIHSSLYGATSSDNDEETFHDEIDGNSKSSFLSRREIMSQSKVMLLSSLLVSSSITSSPPLSQAIENQSTVSESTSTNSVSNDKTILITGCNSGIGYNAALRMAMASSPSNKYTIVLACRTLSKAQETANRIQNDIGSQSSSFTLVPAECDLADLSSISQFVSKTLPSFNIQTLDIVCLNAGLSLDVAAKEVARTKDGFELTIGTNHLGHFYLNTLLLPMINSKTGRIVVTASGVHDPDSPGGAQGSKATLGNLKGLEDAVAANSKQFDMIDGASYDADKAYKDSKLCNVLFTRELQKRLNASNSAIQAFCFNPGLIVGTGLFRNQNQLFTKVFDIAATNVFKVGETTSWGGGALEYLALNPNIGLDNNGKNLGGGLYYTSPPGSSKFGDDAYGKQFSISQVSKEASDDEKAKKLWSLSEKLVGISSTSSS